MMRPIVLAHIDPAHAGSGFEITGECANQFRFIYTHSQEDAMVVARRVACAAVLLDSAGDLNEACRLVDCLCQAGYARRVLVLFSEATGEASARLLASGAAAVLPSANSAAVVFAVLRELLGATHENAMIAEHNADQLSTRDRMVLQLVWDGYSNKEIAARLNCSISLVKASLQRCFAKAGVHTRTQLLRRVIEDRKWIRPSTEAALSH